METYYDDGNGIQIYHGDCFEVMKQFEDKSFDLVLTDPPYGIGKAEWDFIDFRKLLICLNNEFLRLLQIGSLAFIWFPKRELYKLNNIGFDFDIFIEIKNFAQKRRTDIGIDCWVPLLMIRNGDYSRENNKEGFKNWFMVNSANTGNNINNPRKINHPTAKDTEICKYIIEKTKSCIILDPFMGSGTTLIAAKQLGRRAAGIEISEKYCEIAVQRLKTTPVPLF